MPSSFKERCEALFAPLHGRRWKTASASALGVSRATLHRYLGASTDVPGAVLDTLGELEGPTRPALDDRGMIVLAASALVAIQREVDDIGHLTAPYPRTAQRAFDVGAARNLEEGEGRWPTDLRSLADFASRPLGLWAGDMAWDREDLFAECVLVENGELTPACRDLAADSKDPEQEHVERDGFDALRAACAKVPDEDAFYTAWRRCVVERPVLSTLSEAARAVPGLVDLDDWTGFVGRFYDLVPDSMAFGDHVKTCVVSRTLLRRAGRGLHTECRDPAAISAVAEGAYGRKPFRPGQTLHLRRAFRTFWCLPGVAELQVAEGLGAQDWRVRLWPRRDRVDIEAEAPDGEERLAIDVKDHLSPVGLARRFGGFKEYEETHRCLLVVPDYVVEANRRFPERFENLRRAHGKPPVALRTVSALLREARRSG